MGTLRPRRVSLLIAALAVLGTAAASWAYFSSTGTGSAQASIGALAQTTVTATPGAGKVSLSWTPVAASGSGTVTYYVTRDGGDPGGSCPTASVTAATTSCADSGVSIGTHHYTVTAIWRSWTSTSATASATVSFGALDHLALTAPGSATAGSPLTATVTAKDASNNTITDYAGTVHFTSSDTGATLPADYAFVSGDDGSHAFTNAVTLVKAGTQTVSVTDTAHATVSGSASIAVSAGPASQLVFTTQPAGSITGGTAFPTQPVIAAEDANGNTVTTYAGTITLAVKTGTGTSGATLSGCSGSLTAGVTTFSGCKIDKSGTAYQLHASDGTRTADSSTFNVAVGSASQLVFTTQPGGSSTGGTAFPNQPVLTAEDAGGNVVTGYSGTIGLSIKTGSGTSGATLSGCSGSRTSGVTSFSGCKIDKSGSAYQLHASDGTLTADSSTFNIAVGSASQLVFTTQPAGATAGTALTTQPNLTALDAGGNTVTSYNGTIALSIKTGTGTSGATLSGCSGSLTAGVTTFSGCKIDKSGTAYQLHASDGTLTADSSAFNVAAGTATQLVFTTQPTGAAGGAAFTTQPVITAKDAQGNVATSYNGTIALSIKTGTGTSGATLSGCSGSLTAGVTTFSGCKIDKSGTAYQLHASDGTLTADSSAFNVAAGAATKLVFSQQPSNSTGGVAFATQPTVTVQDAAGNTVTTDTSNVTLAITAATGTSGASLTCTSNPKTASAGVASFAGCKIDKAGTGYTLTATDGSLTSAVTNSFNITVGSPAALAFTTQPTGANVNTAFTTQPAVKVLDAGGNTVTTDSSNVTLAITAGSGTSGAALTCTANPKAAASGIATFAGCKINKAGTGYTLTATDGSLTSAVSSGFDVTPVITNVTCGPGTGHRNTIAGTTDDNGGTLTINIFSGAGTGGTLAATLTTTTFTGSAPSFGWTKDTGNGQLTAGAQYTAQATQADSGTTSNSPTCTFTAS